MILIERTKLNKSFFEFSEEYWVSINPYSSHLKRYYIDESLIGRVIKAKEDNLNAHKLGQFNFYKKLLENECNLLKRIVCAHSDNYIDIIYEVEILLKRFNLWPLDNAEDFGNELLNKVFKYENWRTNGKGLTFYKDWGHEVCPYCNLNTLYDDDERKLAIVSFDHFYDKATYPYLSLSFYNIIPVCKICNEVYKGTREFTLSTHCHPYSDNFNQNVKFKSNYFDGCKDYKVKLLYLTDINLRFSSFAKDLGFSSGYNVGNIKKYAKNICLLSKDYDQTKKESMLNEYPFLTLKEVERKICEKIDVPFDENEILNHQFGKLKRDIAKDNGIITTA